MKIAKKLTALLSYQFQWESTTSGLKHKPTGILIKPILFGMRISSGDGYFVKVYWIAGLRLKWAYKAWIKARDTEYSKISEEKISEVVNDPVRYSPKTLVRLKNAGHW